MKDGTINPEDVKVAGIESAEEKAAAEVRQCYFASSIQCTFLICCIIFCRNLLLVRTVLFLKSNSAVCTEVTFFIAYCNISFT